MKISIFGTGYVGLVTGACFAELGSEVLCCDINGKKISRLQKGKIPIYEPGLEDMVSRNIKEKRLEFTTDAKKAVEFGDAIFIAVGTPNGNDGKIEMKYVRTVAETIGNNLNKDRKIIVDKSTVPPGTAKEVSEIISKKLSERKKNFEFTVVSNPEFLKEGDAIVDFMKPDRIVVGIDNGAEWAREIMNNLYAPLIKNGHPIYFMDTVSAEMSKYASNTFLAAKISFINQIANICEIVGADVEEVRKAVSADKRIGHHFFYPGVGYGGSCFPKDVQALVALAQKFNYPAHLIESIEKINEEQKEMIVKKIIKELGNIEEKKIAVWGLAFKPHTDDMRCAASVTIIEKLLGRGAKITAYDPIAHKEAHKYFGEKIKCAPDMYECLRDAEALVLVTEWPQFKEPDFVKIKKLLTKPIIFDGRNIYSPSRLRKLGFKYIGIGRPSI